MPPKKERKKKRAANEEGTNALAMVTDVAICGVISMYSITLNINTILIKRNCVNFSSHVKSAYSFK